MTKKDYTSDNIETLRYPDNVRSNAAMYIGGTDEHGRFVILRELLDNALDEYLAERNDEVQVLIDADGSYWVQDNGHGIPQGTKTSTVNVNGKNVKSSMPTMQAVFGELHTSGKFRSDAYAVSVGSHGVGSKGTNATSSYFEVFTVFKGACYGIRFEKGKLVTPVGNIKAPKSPITGKRLEKGTLIHFKPDPTIFKAKSFPGSMLVEWAEVISYLNPGFKVTLHSKGKSKTWFSKNGPKDYIKARLTEFKAQAEPDLFEFNSDLATVVIAFSDYDGFAVSGFTNGLRNSQGGTHVNSAVKALHEAIKEYAGAKQTFTARDFEDGLLGIVNAKLHKAQFSSQDKAKLTDERVAEPLHAAVLDAASKFFKGNKALAKRLCDRAAKIAELKNRFKSNKAVATALNKVKRLGLPANYAPADSRVPVAQRELLIVEGDSAAGGIRKVRAPHQALLPLSGKILNVLKSKGDKALLSKAIVSILAAIGFDPKQDDPLSKLTVGRIIELSDPDPDGLHINSLLLTLFSTYLPGMFDKGMVYVADMPEFYAIHKDQMFTGPTLSSVQAKLAKAGVKADVLHAKGWGEVDPQVMKILAVDPSTRQLIKIEPLTAPDLAVFRGLMSKAEEGGSDQLKPDKKAKADSGGKKAKPAKSNKKGTK